jgi:hypothetical protein
MLRFLAFISFTAVFAVSSLAQNSVTYIGKLDPQLKVDMVHVYQRVWSATADRSALRFSPSPEKGAVISVGQLIDIRKETGKSTILLVEPPGDAAPYIWFDSNENGIYEASEKVVMNIPADQKDMVNATLKLPITNPY